MSFKLAKPLGALVAGAGLLIMMPGAAFAAPDAPKSIKITRAADDPSRIQITWAPAGGATRYNVSVFDGSNDSVSIVKAPTTAFQLTRPEPCVRLRVNIGSRDSSGAGHTSGNNWLNTLAPGGISGLQAERTGDFTQMTATWKEPTWLGYGELVGYRVQVTRSTDKAVVFNEVVQDTAAAIGGLDPLQNYTLQVAAENGFGSCITGKLSIGNSKPGTVSSLKAVRDPGTPAQVNLSWAPPSYGGYGVVTHYLLGYGETKPALWKLIDDTSTTVTLDPNTNWVVQVKAVNEFGQGGISGLTLPAASAVGTPAVQPGITISQDGSKIFVKMSQKIGAYQEYPKLVVRVNPTVAGGGFSDEHWGANGAETLTFGDVPDGLYTVQVNGANDKGEIEYARQIVNVGGVGLLSSTDWQLESGPGNSKGEVSAITRTARTTSDMALMSDVTVKEGHGYAIWARASIDPGQKISGYLLEYDPNYAQQNTGPTMVLRIQQRGSLCSTPLAVTKVAAALATPGVHKIAVVTNGNSLYATVDNTVVLNLPSLSAAVTASPCRTSVPTGLNAGVRFVNSDGLTVFARTTLN